MFTGASGDLGPGGRRSDGGGWRRAGVEGHAGRSRPCGGGGEFVFQVLDFSEESLGGGAEGGDFGGEVGDSAEEGFGRTVQLADDGCDLCE